jgi:DNA invertase Pin-like site-specific DNA recombinase
MIEQKFDPSLPYRYVIYARMSSDAQNPRSPDQQFATIRAAIQRQGYPWVEVETFRDDAISGKYVWRRSAFAEMIERIKAGSILADLIIVDTFERLGRSDELTDIRRQLATRYGVLVVAADSNFADPTTAMGRVMAAFESVRATEANRIKAHDVLRGKIDAIRQHRWPGGPVPFGFELKSVFGESHGRQVVDFSVPVANPKADWIVRKLFARAAESGWGAGRLTVELNDDPEIPNEFKPFNPSTVGRWLANPLYVGRLVWGENAADIIEDIRVLQPKPEDEVVVEPDFCEGLIDPTVWETVQRVRRARSERSREARERAKEPNGKLVKALVPGVALKYPISGLVVCAECGRAMTVSAGPKYETKSGEIRRYAAYACPGRLGKICPNQIRVSEEWVRGEVIQRLSKHILVGPDGRSMPTSLDAVSACGWFVQLRDQVQQEVDRRRQTMSEIQPDLKNELEEVRLRICGWQQSLGKPDLDPQVRQLLEQELRKAIQRQLELQRLLEREQEEADSNRRLVDAQAILDRLLRLDKVLQGTNPSELNVELGYMIDRISCDKEGNVTTRICRFGLAPELLPLLREAAWGRNSTAESALQDQVQTESGRGTPRRRSIRQVDNRDAARFVADPDRFSGIPNDWFWTETFRQPKRRSWAVSHADEVHSARFASNGSVKKTFEELEEQFGVTKPTLRAALKKAKEKRDNPEEPRADDAA